MPFKFKNHFLNSLALSALALAGCKAAVFGSIQDPKPFELPSCTNPNSIIHEISISVEIERSSDNAAQNCDENPTQSASNQHSATQSDANQSTNQNQNDPVQNKPPVVDKPNCKPNPVYKTARSLGKIHGEKTLCSINYALSELDKGDFAALNFGDDFLFISDKNVTAENSAHKPFSQETLSVNFGAAPICALTDKCAESGPWSVTSSDQELLRSYAKYFSESENTEVTMVWSNAKPKSTKILKATVKLRYVKKGGE